MIENLAYIRLECHMSIDMLINNLKFCGTYQKFHETLDESYTYVIDYNDKPCIVFKTYSDGLILFKYHNNEIIRKFDDELTGNNFKMIHSKFVKVLRYTDKDYTRCIECDEYFKKGVVVDGAFYCKKCSPSKD